MVWYSDVLQKSKVEHDAENEVSARFRFFFFQGVKQESGQVQNAVVQRNVVVLRQQTNSALLTF